MTTSVDPSRVLGAWLKEELEMRDMRQADLARVSGVSVSQT